jgi:hypothetical protein
MRLASVILRGIFVAVVIGGLCVAVCWLALSSRPVFMLHTR